MAFQPEEGHVCPLCRDVFTNPVVLSCGHSFCEDCNKQWWTEKKENLCAVCKVKTSRREPIPNFALRHAAEGIRQKRAEEFCSLHSMKLRLFCHNDLQPVCVICRDSKVHEGHHFRPIEESSQRLRVNLKKDLKQLSGKLSLLRQFEKNCDVSLGHINSQASQTKVLIREEFKKLHQFLKEEEESRMKALLEEEEQRTQTMNDKMAAVRRDIEELSNTIAATEEQLRAPDVSFLLNYKAAVERVQRCPLVEEEPQLGPGALIDQAQHLGNLTFNVWTNMKRLVQFTPVILEPNSASSVTVLSECLTSFKCGPEQKLPKNPERFKAGGAVVRGSEGFVSGSHSWDVLVGGSKYWMVGVITESGFLDSNSDTDASVCAIVFSDGKYVISNKNKDTLLKLKSRPSRIQLHLDCSKRRLTFYDADTNKQLHSVSPICAEKLFPFFGNNTKEPITIFPQKM